MTKFRYEEQSMSNKDDAIDYIKEHLQYESNINGTGSLDSYYEDYQLWLDVNKSLEKYGDIYEQYIEDEYENRKIC